MEMAKKSWNGQVSTDPEGTGITANKLLGFFFGSRVVFKGG